MCQSEASISERLLDVSICYYHYLRKGVDRVSLQKLDNNRHNRLFKDFKSSREDVDRLVYDSDAEIEYAEMPNDARTCDEDSIGSRYSAEDLDEGNISGDDMKFDKY